LNGKSVGKRAAREKAREIFQEYKANGGSVPIDVDRLIEKNGIKLVSFDERRSSLAGMLLVDRDNVIIVVNANTSQKRQRFTKAHELGHYLLHKNPDDPIFHRDERSSQGTDRVEIDANTFAAELLMPAEEVRTRAATVNVDLFVDNIVEELAEEFDVSLQAMSIRLQQLKIIDLEANW